MCESASHCSQLVSRLHSIQLIDRGDCGSGPHHNEMDGTTSTSVSDSSRKKKKKKKKLKAKDEVVHFPTTSIKSHKPFSFLNRKLSSFGKRNGFTGCFCFNQTDNLDNDSSTISDPNHPSFNPQFLKALIENNHFYSKDFIWNWRWVAFSLIEAITAFHSSYGEEQWKGHSKCRHKMTDNITSETLHCHNVIKVELVRFRIGYKPVLHLEGSVKTTELKLTWLPETNVLVNLLLADFDYLITKKKVGRGSRVCGSAESLGQGGADAHCAFFAIPDGRQPTPK